VLPFLVKQRLRWVAWEEGKKEVYRKDGKGVETDGKGVKSYGDRVGWTGREEMRRGRDEKGPWVTGEPRRSG